MTEVRSLTGEGVRAAARTDPGRVRLNNEDLPVIDAARGIFGVIDGVGGHAGGEIAAATARDVILQRLARPVGTAAERVREAIAIANNEIHRRAAESRELRGMACVITLALVDDGTLTVGHVGDSRLYKIRPDGLRKLTRDHSPVGEREDAGELSEVDAMHHPRRHEVFREVGGIHRDKDEQEFVDVVCDTVERDSAILLCSDGLSDMLPASAIGHLVRQHAGDPERVVDALVAAANDAGGRDNITVVYAEMPEFARAMGHGGARLAPTEPLAGPAESAARPAPAPAASPRRGGAGRLVRSIVDSRTTWFAFGTLIGVIGALALTLSVAKTQLPSSQTLIVGADPTAPYGTIMNALAAARPGDVVRVEPGVYRELVHLRDGVDLTARVPGTVTISRPAGVLPAAATLAITGALNVRVHGIRIESPPDLPGDGAVRISSPAATLELVEILGPYRQAINLSTATALTMSGSRVAVTGAVVAVPDDGHATLTNNILARTGASTEPAITATPSAHVTLRSNVFSGYGAEILAGLPEPRRREILEGNTIIPRASARPAPPRPAGRNR